MDPKILVVINLFSSLRLDINIRQSFQCNNCSLAKLTPAELVRKHEEAEVCLCLKAINMNYF